MIFESNIIKERTIEDAWRSSMWCCVRNGYAYRTRVGSYTGQLRKQLDYVVMIIEQPYTRPLAVSLPENSGIPAPTSEEAIQQYFYEYLATDTKAAGEDYTYGQYIAGQTDRLIEILNTSEGMTNQACMNVGNEASINLADPPCLRVADFKVVNGLLQLNVYFRSWDLFAGFPQNIGGLQLLKEYILTHLNFKVDDGPIVAYSSGAHIYEQYFSLVDCLNVDKIAVREKS